MKQKPQHLTMDGNEYPLVFLTHYTGRRDSAYVLMNGKPVISIEYHYGTPYTDGIERVATALRSFRQNKGVWSLLPESAHGFFDDIRKQQAPAPAGHYDTQLANHVFDLSLIALKTTTVDIYELCKTPHMIVTTREGESEVNFAIWDRDLMRSIATRYNQRNLQEGKRARLTQGSPAMHNVLCGIVD